MTEEEEEILSKEELENLQEIEEMLKKDSKYVAIAPGNKTVLKFVLGRKIRPVEKQYNGQTSRKVRFIVIDPNSGSNDEKFFDVGMRSTKLILPKLKKGNNILKIERIGSGKDTLYVPTEVS
jgi:hypothetical protein